MVNLAFLIPFLLALAVRYLPELHANWRNRGRKVIRVSACRVKSWHIASLWAAILAGSAYRLALAPPGFSAVSVSGFAIFLAGIAIGLAACRALGSSYSVDLVLYPESRLIASGIFSRVRHPLRLGLALELLGAILFAGAWILLLPWVAAVLGLVYRTRAEEEMLRRHYGAAAAHYQSTVPACNPFIRPKPRRQA